MPQIETRASSAASTQRIYARLAGFLFLWLIFTGITGMVLTSHIVGTGTFEETARRAMASQHLYRIALSIGLLEPLSTVLLAFALYVILKPIDPFLAQLAMYWRMGEAFLGAVATVVGFLTLHLYSHPQPIRALATDELQGLVNLIQQAGSILIAEVATGLWLIFLTKIPAQNASVLGS